MEKKLIIFREGGVGGGTPFAENSAKIINLIFEPFPKGRLQKKKVKLGLLAEPRLRPPRPQTWALLLGDFFYCFIKIYTPQNMKYFIGKLRSTNYISRKIRIIFSNFDISI